MTSRTKKVLADSGGKEQAKYALRVLRDSVATIGKVSHEPKHFVSTTQEEGGLALSMIELPINEDAPQELLPLHPIGVQHIALTAMA